MSRWIGSESPRPPGDPRLAKVMADLALLRKTATATLPKLADLRATPPLRMSADIRTRIAAVHDLCQLVADQAQQLIDELVPGGHERNT
jgi:hypothetical protein